MLESDLANSDLFVIVPCDKSSAFAEDVIFAGDLNGIVFVVGVKKCRNFSFGRNKRRSVALGHVNWKG